MNINSYFYLFLLICYSQHLNFMNFPISGNLVAVLHRFISCCLCSSIIRIRWAAILCLYEYALFSYHDPGLMSVKSNYLLRHAQSLYLTPS